jgi:hypothetical protein|tara:strand:- start:22 stop:453 length:432 start_codon:yes stop_codon:yes gene_type:complete
MNQPMNRTPAQDLVMSRRENLGTGTAGARALAGQMARPNMALPSSTPQTNMPELPMNPMQMVTGKDGKKYQIVIDPSTGLQTFIPYREPAGRGMGQMRGMGEMPGMSGQGSRMERIQRLASRMGQMQGQNPTNRLSSLLSASG